MDISAMKADGKVWRKMGPVYLVTRDDEVSIFDPDTGRRGRASVEMKMAVATALTFMADNGLSEVFIYGDDFAFDLDGHKFYHVKTGKITPIPPKQVGTPMPRGLDGPHEGGPTGDMGLRFETHPAMTDGWRLVLRLPLAGFR